MLVAVERGEGKGGQAKVAKRGEREREVSVCSSKVKSPPLVEKRKERERERQRERGHSVVQ